MQQRNEKHPCMMSLVFEKCLHDAHGARCNISFSCSLTCCLLSPLLLPLLLPLPQLPACCIVTERWQEATCRYYCMAENSEANECNKSEKMKKDYNSNVHERMHVCMCARMCVAALWFKSFCFAMCRPSSSYAQLCPYRCTFLSCSCPAKEDSNSDVHACVYASCACMCMCVATNILRVMLRYAAQHCVCPSLSLSLKCG